MPLNQNPGRVLITGGASGLGLAVARAVAEAGGRPLVIDRTVPDGYPHPARQADVTDRPAVERAVAELVDAEGGLDAVVTAAGIDTPGALGDVPAEDWERVVLVNLFGTASTVRASLPHLEASHGRVVTVASSLGIKAVGDATAYCASKFGVVGFTRSLAAELRGRVGVTTLIPSGMNTNFFEGRTEQYKPADDSRLNDPATVADAVLFALAQPRGTELRELVICHEDEESWP